MRVLNHGDTYTEVSQLESSESTQYGVQVIPRPEAWLHRRYGRGIANLRQQELMIIGEIPTV